MSDKLGFARWLARQQWRSDGIGDLSRAAAVDAHFPWPGGPAEMHDRVRALGGSDSRLLHALGAALDEWNGAPYPLHLDRARRDAEALARSHTRFKAAMEATLRRLRVAKPGPIRAVRGTRHGAV